MRELHCWASTLLPAWLAHDDLFSLLLGPFHGMAPSLYSATVGAAAAGGAGGSGRGSASWGDHQPGAVSLLDLCHWTQTLRYNASARAPRMTAASPGTASASGFLSGVRAPALRMCDFGARENLARYGQAEPPQYDLARIPRSLPKAFFCGGRDQLMALSDLEALVDRLRANAASPTPAHLTHGSAAPASPSRTMGEGVGGGFKVGLGPGSAGMGMGGRRAAPSLSVPTAELLVADIPSFNHTDYLWYHPNSCQRTSRINVHSCHPIDFSLAGMRRHTPFCTRRSSPSSADTPRSNELTFQTQRPFRMPRMTRFTTLAAAHS